ncbi:ATP-grasp domain-containing protein [Eubacterium sp. 1001713B170207_170306_E7]|uniref:ATP-grasp domain-containing protein n=1 Tax=Eubacterium sp. 1001713B170207_170306_E7 TaxID=2787097 RepID=UPI001896D89D|nr:ATP-grasp domain-containing protein [Eubacterium sp. 1001713B170207_170306_E7]
MKAIILAGGYDQIALIQELKKRGFETILIDYYENPPAKNFADNHYQVSTLDIEEIKKIAVKENVDLVTTACTDQALLSIAKVSEELVLPCYISYEKALNVTNKKYMKNVMNKSDIPTAKHRVVSDVKGIDLSEFKFPIVVKPTDCNSSKGVQKSFDAEEGLQRIKEAIDLSRSKTAIIEEYIEGFEISLDAFISDGKAEILLITRSEKIKNSNGFTIVQSRFPVDLDHEIIKKIGLVVQSICECFALPDGPLLVQMIVSGQDVFIIEFSARMGGGTKYKLIETLTGFNIMSSYVDLITGITPKIKVSKKYSFAHLNYCYVEEGIFNNLYNFKELKEKGIINDYFKYKSEGTLIDKAKTSSDRVAGYLITADTIEELNTKEKLANKNVGILTNTGKDIMIHDLI